MNEAWRDKNPFGRLREYELKNFVLDLEERGPHEKLHRVLLLEDSDGRNAWYEAKTAIGAGAAYSADISRAWSVLKQQNKHRIAQGVPLDIATELRYALTTTLLRTGRSRSAGFTTAFVQKGWWTPEEAVSYALREPSWQRRIVTLTALSKLLEGDWQLAAQKGVLSNIAGAAAASRTQVSLSSESNGERGVSDYKLAAQCLGELVPTLADALIDTALDAAEQVGNIWHYHAMSAAVKRLDGERRQAQAESLWDSALKYRASFWKAEALSVVAPLTVGEQWSKRMEEAAYASIEVLDDEEGRAYRLQTPITGIMLLGSSILVIRLEDLRALSQIAPLLTGEQLQKVLLRAKRLSGEMREAAYSVLLPELWRAGVRSQVLAGIQKIKQLYFRARAYAVLAGYGFRNDAALEGLLTKTESLDGTAERALCRAALARFVPVSQRCSHISRVLEDLEQQKDATLPGTVLLDLPAAFEGAPLQDRVGVVHSVLAVASDSFWGNVGDQDLLGCALVPYLDEDSIREKYAQERVMEINVSENELAVKLRAALSAEPIQVKGPGTISGSVSIGPLAEALKSQEGLSPSGQSRTIVLAAQLASGAELITLAEAAAAIDNELMRSFALYALMQRAIGEGRCKIGLQLLDVLLALHGGLAGAEPFFQGVARALRDRRSEAYESYSAFVSDISQADVDVGLNDVIPTAPLWQVLTGSSGDDELTATVRLLKRWWGEQDSTEEAKPGRSEPKTRFKWRPLPVTEQGVALELITMLGEQRVFAAGEQFLLEMIAASRRDPAWLGATEEAINRFLTQCAAAGETDRSKRLLPAAPALHAETARDLARMYVKEGHFQEAMLLCAGADARLRPEIAWATGVEVLEALTAEDQPETALKLLADLVSLGIPLSACDHFIDSYFVVGNAVMRSRVPPLAERFATLLDDKPLLAEVCKSAHARLLDYAGALEQQGDAGRAQVWRMFAELFRPSYSIE